MKQTLTTPLPSPSKPSENVPASKKEPFFRHPAFRAALQSLGNALLTLAVIAYLTLFGLIMAERGREKLPAQPLNAAGQALTRMGDYVFDHPETYFWHKTDMPWTDLVRTTLLNSAGLLLAAMALAAVAGISLGALAARAKGRTGSALVVITSVLGMSTPSFLLGMLLWIFNAYVIHRTLGMKALPQAGFGWDLHMLMPAIVLATRPFAQVAQITYVSLTDIMGQDYIRTARAKGASKRLINNRHALRNVLIPILTTLGTSLRYSLASLPIVELFFAWPGLGQTLLQAIDLGNSALITDLIVALGAFFLVFNLVLDVLYPLIDPRLRKTGGSVEKNDSPSLVEGLRSFIETIGEMVGQLVSIFRPRQKKQMPALLAKLQHEHIGEGPIQHRYPFSWYLRVVFGNPAFLIGGMLVLAFVGLAIFGEQLTTSNPFQIHGVEMVDGTIGAPPFDPSPTFPWGTDHIGRDVQAFVLAGAKRTITLAFFAMLARVALGTVLGLLAGWWQESWFDRFVLRVMNIWAAFPVTIFAMLLIQALGIQQGMWVFIVALCLVGWGEVTQFVRAQTIRIKPQLYIESARALGARPAHLLSQQVFPNLVSSVVVMAALEMGGVLLLLAELGFLNIFLGGGFSMELSVDKVTLFSDVPEWGAMLANIRDNWRSYPWMAWYPGVAFFAAIMAFNLFGEGLRHFLEETRVNLSRLFNRYTFSGGMVVILLASFTLQSTTPLNLYSQQSKNFNVENVLVDIGTLSGEEFAGRETGMPGSRAAAEYIARRMQEVGLFFSTPDRTYFLEGGRPRQHLLSLPTLDILNGSGNTVESMLYRQDFVEIMDFSSTSGQGEGPIIGLALGESTNDPKIDGAALNKLDIYHNIAIVRDRFYYRIPREQVTGLLVVVDDPHIMEQKFLPNQRSWYSAGVPAAVISPATADKLLQTAGSSLAELDALTANLKPGEAATTNEGASVSLKIEAEENPQDTFTYVVGVLPGTGAKTESGTPGLMMDGQAIVVAAHYDGLGVGPDGTLYPGANDNASGVATMLELARVLKSSDFAPKKTIIFIAWSGGERMEQMSLVDIMNASPQLDSFKYEGVIELTGVGAGEGKAISLGEGSSYRLLKLFQEAAGKLNVATTTRGRGPHYQFPILRLANPRDVPSIYLSWDGSDFNAHTQWDTPEFIDPMKLERVGQSTLLMLTVMSREINY